MSALPTGTVTLLFTDIEGSTSLLQRLGRERYVEALEAHRRLLREAFAGHGGVEVEMQGDSFHFAFTTAQEAVAAAASGQHALAVHAWEHEPIRVRIGLHTGTPTISDNLYAGLDVHRAARVMASGHGRQVLLSHTTRQQLANDALVLDLGEHRLKDLLQPEHLYQLLIEGVPQDFPALKTLGNRPTNLPVQPNPLIGRERELAEVGVLLREDVRLLTLTGTGGIGKTRLALHVGAELLEEFRSGVFFVPLASIGDSRLVIPAIAQAFAVREVAGEELGYTLTSYLEDKEVLLLLDNFEQVVGAAGLVADILSRCPSLTLLVTSRERLRLAPERVYEVPPLALPGATDELDALLENESVALFLARAQSAKPDFRLTAENSRAVAKICLRLDGLPLALELAAARVGVLTPQALLDRLSEQLKLLTRGRRDADDRQQTLRRTIEWSYQLLSTSERTLFARLSVFVGGCRYGAADAVCDSDGDLGIDLVDGLQSLIEKSLLRHANERYWMIEMIREYAFERLVEAGERDRSSHAHAQFFADLMERLDRERGAGQGEAFAAIAREHDNIRVALQHSVERGDADLTLRLTAATGWFWFVRGHWTEGRRWLGDALRLASTPSALRGKALMTAGILAEQQGEPDTATAIYTECLALRRDLGDEAGIAATLNNLANVSLNRGDHDRAQSLYDESLALARRAGDEEGIASALCNLGEIALLAGDYIDARPFFEESLAVARRLEHAWGCALVLGNLGVVLIEVGELESASNALAEALQLYGELSSPAGVAATLERLADALARAGEGGSAARLLGAATAVRGPTSGGLNQPDRESVQALLRESLEPELLATLLAEGELLDLEAAVASGLEAARSVAPA